MTHLAKPGYASPFHAKTACGITAATINVVDHPPECPICHEVYLQQLVNAEAEQAEFQRTHA